jgi:hypothetical protein
MKVSVNNSQKQLIAALLPIVGIIILFILPTAHPDKRPLHLSILIVGLTVMYLEVILFGLENKLVNLGRKFGIGFPVVVLLVASAIALSKTYSGWADNSGNEVVLSNNALIDSRVAVHWLLLILFLGAVEFRLMSLRSVPNKENAIYGTFKKKPINALEAFIFSVYGNPPPPKTANLNEAIQIAHDELLMGVVSKKTVIESATQLNAGPIPYSTHDLALSVALLFFKQPDLVPQLGDAQLVARMKALDWMSQKKVAPPLVQSFESTLYKFYKL